MSHLTCGESDASGVVNDGNQVLHSYYIDTSPVFEENWKIEKILGVIEKDGNRLYKVKLARVIWQSEASLQSLQHLLQEFYQEYSYSIDNANEVFDSCKINCSKDCTSTKFLEDASLGAAVKNVVVYANEKCMKDGESDQCDLFDPDDSSKSLDCNHVHPSDSNDKPLNKIQSNDPVPGTVNEANDAFKHHRNSSTHTVLFSEGNSKKNKSTWSIRHLSESEVRKKTKCNISSRTYGEVKKLFSCRTCGKAFNRKTSLQRHYLIHTGEKPWQCQFCLKSFNQNSILQRHLLIHSIEKAFHCKQCDKTFTEKAALKRHEATHSITKKWRCKHCDKTFNLKEYLAKHELLHSGLKRYQCSVCGRSFADSCALKRHIAVHENDKLFCVFCRRSFKSLPNFKKHSLNCQHCYCVVCNRLLQSNEMLLKHLETHSEPFICNYCATEFDAYEVCISHMIDTHTTDKHKCVLCPDEAFFSKTLLEKHVIKVHGPVEQVEMSHQLKTSIGSFKTFENEQGKDAQNLPKSFNELFKSALLP